jgi:protease-4
MYDAEKKLLTDVVEELYQQFVDVVDAGRDQLDREQVQRLANGAIYTAKQALESGLIDEIGDTETIETWWAERGPVQIVELRRKPNLRDILFGAEAKTQPDLTTAAAALLHASSGPRFLYFWQGAR